MRITSFVLAFGVLLAGGSLTACDKAEAPKREDRPVLTQVVKLENSIISASYTGNIRSRYEYELSFRVPGKISKRFVDIGARVKPGDILARLDPVDNALTASASRAQVSAAEAERDFARAEYERYKGLRAKNFISDAQLDQKQNVLSLAEAKLNAAKAQADVTGNQQNYTELKADQPGVVGHIAAEVGQVVAAGQPVFLLAREDTREVAISIPESRIQDAVGAEKADITLWAQPGRVLTGKLREVTPAADPATRTFAARVAITDPALDDSVLFGMTANVTFTRPALNPQIRIPLTSMFQKDDKPAVWVLTPDSKVQLRPITVSSVDNTSALLSSGLQDGERIVVAGVHK
ncbi:MAG TPA: efflux RND transporter periplasmic adaptor subunit, partial [Pseudomonadales bacterium]|nr:efflux RND transporter periplasmic adaptor subunit [Pseudomonadales bacterium]